MVELIHDLGADKRNTSPYPVLSAQR